MTQAPPASPTPAPYLKPHRGTMILVFGILGIAICFPLGIVAWVLGNNDLTAMRAGTMDPTGEGLTQAGKVCGIISVVLAILGTCITIGWLILVGGVLTAGAGGAAGA